MIAVDELTPTQRRLFELLSDGGQYTLRQIADHFGDSVEESGITSHVSDLRAILSPHGLVIVCHNRGRQRAGRYQLLRRYTPGE